MIDDVEYIVLSDLSGHDPAMLTPVQEFILTHFDIVSFIWWTVLCTAFAVVAVHSIRTVWGNTHSYQHETPSAFLENAG